MVLGYVKCAQGEKALKVSVTFVGFLNACVGVGALVDNRYFHE